MQGQNVLNIPWLKLHAWLMADPSSAEDEAEAQPIEDFVYHRPALLREVQAIFAPVRNLGHAEGLPENN